MKVDLTIVYTERFSRQVPGIGMAVGRSSHGKNDHQTWEVRFNEELHQHVFSALFSTLT